MNLKIPIYSLIVILGLFLFSCANDNEDGLAVDCSGSNISVSVSTATEATCTTLGSLELAVTGNEGNVSFSLDGTNFDLSNVITGLAAGSYSITVKDESGCTASLEASVAASDDSIEANLTVSETICGTNAGQIEITATGGSGSYEYSIDGETFTTEAIFSGLNAGSYTVDVRDGGCETTLSARIRTGVSLENDIMPIINSNCAITGCHANVTSPRFNSKEDVIAAAARIKARTQAKTMPPASRPEMSQEEIDLIACWVDDDALDN